MRQNFTETNRKRDTIKTEMVAEINSGYTNKEDNAEV